MRVARIHDSTVAKTALEAFDVGVAKTELNKWYKSPVVEIDLVDDGLKDIRFDTNNNGALDLEPGQTSPEQQILQNAYKPAGAKVVIVKSLNWIFYLSADAKVGDNKITLKNSYVPHYIKFVVDGNVYRLGTGADAENITIDHKVGSTVHLKSPLTKDHNTNEGIMWPLGGLSGNPIYVQEKGKDAAKVCETVGHECGHSPLGWLDLNDPDCLMHFSSGNVNTNIRYKERPKKYDAGNEKQWDTTSR